MRIISKTHDYYDIVIGLGVDPLIVYNRVVKKESLSKIKYGIANYLCDNVCNKYSFGLKLGTFIAGNTFIVLFCGKVYPGIEFKVYHDTKIVETQIVYSKEEALSFCEKEILKYKKDWKVITLPRRRESWYSSFNKDKNSTQSQLDSIFELSGSNYLFDKLVDDKVVIMSIKERLIEGRTLYETTTNPILKNFKFYKLFDAVQAYQEISMFVGGILPKPGNPTLTISDNDMRDKKGFDKYSFRKQKEL